MISHLNPTRDLIAPSYCVADVSKCLMWTINVNWELKMISMYFAQHSALIFGRLKM